MLTFQSSPATTTYQHSLQPGLLPASVVVVILHEAYKAALVAGGIPATVRLLRLPRRYAVKDLTSVLSPSTQVVWCEEQER